jgi:hypothetical protein
MAILVRGRWGIRRWTASPIGRLVTRPNYFEVKVNIELLSTGILLQPHS